MRFLPFALIAVALAACGARSSLLEGSGEAGQGGSTSSSTGQGGGVDVVRACVIAASCSLHELNAEASGCVDSFARLGWDAPPHGLPDPLLAARLLECATTSDCEAVRQCFGGSWITLERCRIGGVCSGNEMFLWTDGSSFDCSTIGATCQDLWSQDDQACCNAEPCSTSTEVTCDGNVASYCGPWGARVTFDCTPSGLTCVPVSGQNSVAPCAGDGAPCESDATTCQGSVATYCSGGKLATIDCATIENRSACADGAPPSLPPCVAAGKECEPELYTSKCQGDALTVCVDGVVVPVSCTALGFDKCVPALDLGHARCGI